jgi:peptide deformylase
MILEIKKYPDPVLKQKTEEVKEISKEIEVLIGNMVETMQKKDGLGLAAPQVGVAKKIIVVQSSKGPMAFINPCIISKSKEKEIVEEGCLSFPGVWLKIKRSKGVEINALNIEGKEINLKAVGLLARILQHEIDHLEGKLIINRLSFFQKLKSKI